MKKKLISLYYIVFLIFIINGCNNDYYIFEKKIKNNKKYKNYSDKIFEISKDSTLYFTPTSVNMKLAQGKLIKINKKQMLFKSKNNFNSVSIKVSERFDSNIKSGTKKFYFKNIKSLGNFANQYNTDESNMYKLYINKSSFGYSLKDTDSITVNFPFKIQGFFITYETERLAPNKKLRTIDYNVIDSISNSFKIEAYFSDYLVYSYDRVDTLTVLPFGRIKLSNNLYERKFRKIYFKKSKYRISNKYGYN